MLFEGLVNPPSGGLPTTAQRVRSSRSEAIGGISILSSSAESRGSAIAGAVLVSSKVLRALALLAGYSALASGLSSVCFAMATLALASVGLIVLQRPWSGKKLGTRSFIHLSVQSFLLASSCALWASGLLLCGPATTVMLEYAEVILMRVGRKLFASAQSAGGDGGRGRWLSVARSLLLFGAGVAVMAWGRTEGSRVAARLQELEVAKQLTMDVMHTLEGEEAQGHDIAELAPDALEAGRPGQRKGGGKAWGAAEGAQDGQKRVSDVMLHELVMSGLDASVQLDNGRESEQEEEERGAAAGAWDKGESGERRQEWGEASAQHAEAQIPLEFGARTAGDFLQGVCFHGLAALLSALRKQQLYSTCKMVGGPKRFFALACPLAVVQLLLLAAYAHLTGQGKWVMEGGMGSAEGAAGGLGLEGLALAARARAGGWGSHGKGTVAGSWRELMQFASMGLLVPFYAGNFADKKLPGGECARIGLVSSAAALIFSWAVRMSPAELSSGVVAVTVLFLVLSIGDDVKDDSVPVGVYSVPGLSSGGFKAAWATARGLGRQLLADRASTRLSVCLLLHALFLLCHLLYGLLWRQVAVVRSAVSRGASVLSLGVSLCGAVMVTWRPSPAFSYGYSRFEALAGFSNALLLLLLSSRTALQSAHRLWVEGTVGAEKVPVPVLSLGSLAVNLVAIACIADKETKRHGLGSGGRGGGGKQKKEAKSEGDKRRALRRLEERRQEAEGQSEMAVLARAVRVGGVLLGTPAGLMGRASRGHSSINLQAVHLQLLADAAARVGELLAWMLAEKGGGGGGQVVGALVVGLTAAAAAWPVVMEAAGVLLQVTPPELLPLLPDLHKEILGLPRIDKIDDIHIWRLSRRWVVATVKVKVAAAATGSEGAVLRDLTTVLRSYGVHQTSVQVEGKPIASPAGKRAALIEQQIRADVERGGLGLGGGPTEAHPGNASAADEQLKLGQEVGEDGFVSVTVLAE